MTEATLKQMLHDLPSEMLPAVHFSMIERNELRLLVNRDRSSLHRFVHIWSI